MAESSRPAGVSDEGPGRPASPGDGMGGAMAVQLRAASAQRCRRVMGLGQLPSSGAGVCGEELGKRC